MNEWMTVKTKFEEYEGGFVLDALSLNTVQRLSVPSKDEMRS